MKSTNRPWISLVCLLVNGFLFFQTTAGWAQIQTPPETSPYYPGVQQVLPHVQVYGEDAWDS